MNPPNSDKRTMDRIVGAMAALACLLVATTMILVCLEVIWSLLTGRALSWVNEIVEYSLLWMTFLGSAWVLKQNAHIRMDMLVDRITPRSREMLNAVTSYFGAVICFILVYFSAAVTWHNARSGFRLMTYLEPPSAYINIIIPVGFLLIGLEFVIKGNHSVRAFKG